MYRRIDVVLETEARDGQGEYCTPAQPAETRRSTCNGTSFPSRAAGCQYCMAHTAGHALNTGVDDAKLAAVWDYRTSPLFNDGERAALDVALAAGQVPNDVTDAMFTELRKYWNEGEIVEIVAVIAFFGFLNRWNDTMATPLEADPVAVGEKHLAGMGWSVGRHARTS